MITLFRKNLPWGTMSLISIGNLLMEINLIAHMGYLPTVLHYLQVSWLDVGVISSVVYFLHSVSAGFGGLSVPLTTKSLGHKKTFILMLTMSSFSAFFFAFSRSVWWICISIVLKGFFAGGVMSVRLISNDMCNEDNQYDILSWTIQVPLALAGLIGPSVTSLAVLLPTQYPTKFGSESFLNEFPILVPNLFIGLAAMLISLLSCCYLPKDFIALSEQYTESANETTELLQAANMTSSPEDDVTSNEVTDGDAISLQEDTARGNTNSGIEQWSDLSILKKIKTLMCKKDLLLGTILITVHEALASGYSAVLPLWLETPINMSGFGMLPKKVGAYFGIVACVSLVSNAFVAPYLNPKMGAKVSFQVWSLVLVVLIALLPVQVLVGVIAVLVIHMALVKCFEGAAFLSSILFVNNATSRESAQLAIVFSYTFAKVIVSLANLTFGSIFAWSLTNNKGMYDKGLGFPFNYSFSFLCIALLHFVCAIVAIFLRNDIDARQA